MMSGLLILPGNRELCCVDSYSIGRSEFCISGIDQIGAVDAQEVVPQEVCPLAYAGFVAKAGLFYFLLAFRNSGVVNTAAESVTQSSKTYR
jgi:hypothetical protein